MKRFSYLLALIVLSCGVAFAVEQTETVTPKVVAADSNKDGKPDRWQYYENGKISKVETDSNDDGKIDERAFFTDGKVKKAEKDSDFDGKIDQWMDY